MPIFAKRKTLLSLLNKQTSGLLFFMHTYDNGRTVRLLTNYRAFNLVIIFLDC